MALGKPGGDGGTDAVLMQTLIASLLNPTRPPVTPQSPPPAAPQSVATPPTGVTAPSNLQAHSEQFLAEGEELLGPVNPASLRQVGVYVRPEGDTLVRDAEAHARDPLGSRAHLTRAEYASRYAATPEEVSRLVRYYTFAQGLRVLPNRSTRRRGALRFVDRTVNFLGRVGDLNRAFGVTLFNVLGKDGGIYTTYLGGLSVPPELEGLAHYAFLDNRPRVRSLARLSQPLGSGAPSRVAYTPIEVAQAYGFPSNVTGKGQTIAIIEFGGGARLRDLIRYFRGLGLQLPQIQAIGVGGAGNAPTGNPGGPDSEVMLDIEIAGAIANGANYVVYFAPNNGYGFFQGINAAIHDDVNRPSIISISWGGSEQTWTRGEMYAINEAFQAAARMGISVFVAAGDSGSTDGASVTEVNVNFPASSPWATACGGTSLYVGASAPPEKVWNNGDAGGSGGGISTVFPAPSFQTGILYQSAPLAGRGLPDVAGCADPDTGYKVRVDGVDTVYGGTSCVAPLWAGLTALLNESTGASLGFLNPLLYLTNLKGALKDITVGNNNTTGLAGGYPAGVGWDPCTGFGSPNATAIIAALS